MEPLRNPEVSWSRAATQATIDRAEVERRIGPTSEPIEVLSGGFANVNVRVGRDRVLRIKGDLSTLAKEVTLLRRPWRSFRTPSVLATGDDFLVLEHLALAPLPPTAGAAAGRALAEIHAITYPEMGLLAGDLSIAVPIPDDSGIGGYVRAMLREAEPFLDATLAARVRAHLEAIADDAAAAMYQPVLTHCDFKVSNLHVTPTGELVVLDWEFAWAGPRLMDVGQLLRWHPPEPFVRAFAGAYRDGGGVLADGWRRIAAAIDLGHMLGVFAHNPIMRTTDDIPQRIAETLDAG
jgi:phosphotransferase family enzyme